MLTAGASTKSVPSKNDFSSLCSAITAKDDATLSLLFSQGINLTILNEADRTPIEYICLIGRWDCVIALAQQFKTDSDDRAHYNQALYIALVENKIDVMRALLMACTPINSKILAEALSNNNREAIALLQQHVDSWTDATKSELLDKYVWLRSLQDKVSPHQWRSNKVLFGITFFSTSAPNGIQKLQEKLSALPSTITHLEQDWPLIEAIYSECQGILNLKNQPYNGLGDRAPKTYNFYRDTFSTMYDNFEPSPLVPVKLKK